MKFKIKYLFGLIILVELIVGGSGCATQDARKHLESVAKDWCETIRASQVIPVYPLSQDVIVGDVYLVQTPIGEQQKDYERKGFLALDAHQVRLQCTNFSNMYFDGYWQDDFGKTPHAAPVFTNVNLGGVTFTNVLTSVAAPRVAFPTYSFEAQSGYGLSAAFPIQGIPVALSFLGSDQVNGSVTIADAYTYGVDEDGLISNLCHWADEPNVRLRLSQTVEMTAPTPIFLRVISRVFVARAVEVSLQKASTKGGSAQAGNAPNVSLLGTNGGVNSNYTNLLNTLNTSQSGASGMVAGATQAGGAVKFVSASGSTIGMSQSFDRLLTIGYLGFDVPVYRGGDLGIPVPTFLRLNNKVKDAPVSVGLYTVDEARFKTTKLALETLTRSNPTNAVVLMRKIASLLDSHEFAKISMTLQSLDPTTATVKSANGLATQFEDAAVDYVSASGSSGERYARYDQAFIQAFRDVE